jgi:hypothetical protein
VAAISRADESDLKITPLRERSFARFARLSVSRVALRKMLRSQAFLRGRSKQLLVIGDRAGAGST